MNSHRTPDHQRNRATSASAIGAADAGFCPVSNAPSSTTLGNHILAALEGGMILSKSLGKEKIFEGLAAMLKKLCDAVSAPSDRQA
jgi:hypothetical protein